MNEMRIYVASLSDYNNGRLEGKWFDLSDYSDASELMEAIQEMLDDLTKKYNDGEVREEWAVHDYEGIPSTLASEYMGEQDFQQLYDIAEVADDRGIPVEVLVERAGDTGSDDYQALADSLMFVVDGNDESDIVYEYEEQLGGLGNDFWSNHIYIDDVTERVMYGEDVDRFREDILYENPDMDEDEAERQAEEMADEEAERREDLTTYLEDMGYGHKIPSFVSKDYEGAWKRSLSYDFDVIHHDGEMYVFSNNYSVGGTILSGMIGAYIGYQVGKQGLNKVAYKTGEKLGKATRRVKSSVKRAKKRFASGGGVDGDLYFAIVRNPSDKNYWKLGWSTSDTSFRDTDGREYDKLYFAGSKNAKKYYLDDINYLSDLEEFTATSSRENGINFLLARELFNGYRYYIINLDDKSIFTESSNIDGIKQEVRRLTNGKNFYGKKGVNFGQGGGVDNVVWEKGFVEPDEDSDDRRYAKYETEIGNLQIFISEWSHRNWNILIQDKRDYKYLKSETFEGDLEGAKHYAISLAKELKSKGFATGGGIGFKALSAKVAKRYEGKKPEAKYRGEYGKRYSKSEAKEVGDKVAGKVYWQQQGRKMEDGGFVVYAENEEGYYRKLSQHDTMRGAKTKMDNLWKSGEYEKLGAIPVSEWENKYAQYTYATGGGVDGLYTKYLITEYQVKDDKKITFEYDSYEDARIRFNNLIDKTLQEHRATREFNTYLITLEGYVEGKGYEYISDYEFEDKYNRDDEYATGGGVDYPNHYLEVEDLNQKINALTQQIEADYRNNEIDNYTDRNERELVRLKERLDWLMWGKDSYSQGGGISGLNDLIRG